MAGPTNVVLVLQLFLFCLLHSVLSAILSSLWKASYTKITCERTTQLETRPLGSAVPAPLSRYLLPSPLCSAESLPMLSWLKRGYWWDTQIPLCWATHRTTFSQKCFMGTSLGYALSLPSRKSICETTRRHKNVCIYIYICFGVIIWATFGGF